MGLVDNFHVTHKGTRSIRAFQHNIVKQFEDTTPEFIQQTSTPLSIMVYKEE